jgi:trk system potassium uptake protein
MRVIVVGGGKVGTYLGVKLASEGHWVRVIEDHAMEEERLRRELPAEAVIIGDGADPEVLETAGIREANVVAATTGDDETNLVVTNLARFEFEVPRVIARVSNPKNAWMFTAEMGVDVALNQADLMSNLIREEMSLGDMMTLLSLRKGQFSVVEEKVHPQSRAAGRAIADLGLARDVALVAVLRRGELLVPRPDLMLESSDEVIALARAQDVERLAAVLGRAG